MKAHGSESEWIGCSGLAVKDLLSDCSNFNRMFLFVET